MSQYYSQDLYGSETYSQQTTDSVGGDGTYNEIYYNENVYNAAILVLGLVESLTSSDGLGKELQRLAFESLPLADNLLRFFNQVDEMNLDYFSPTDYETIEFNKAAVDSVATSDSPVIVSFVKGLLESMSPADAINFVYTTSKSESVVLSDAVFKAITNKRIAEILRLKDWVSLRKTGSEWYD